MMVSCPHCRKSIAWSNENRWRPFCSERCRLIDLGQWASESYRVPTQEPIDGVDEKEFSLLNDGGSGSHLS